MELGNKIWLILDQRAGHKAQVLGVSNDLKKLNFEIIEKQIKFTFFSRLPNFLKPTYLFGVDSNVKNELTNALKVGNLPSIIIGAGRKTAPIVCWLKKRVKKINKNFRVISVQLMDPKFHNSSFDLLVIPQHDSPSKRKNVYPVISTPVAISDEILNTEAEKWSRYFRNSRHPIIALIVGGDTKEHKFTPKKAYKLVTYINKLVQKRGGGLLVSTSRRTDKKLATYLRKELKNTLMFYDANSDNKENPYYGFLALCDAVVVTGDSVNMVTEACFLGKPVFVYDAKGIVSNKIKSFLSSIYTYGYARSLNKLFFSSFLKEFDDFFKKKIPIHKLNVNNDIAQKIKHVYYNEKNKDKF